jgi:Rod binding domain-containing protein
MFEQMRSGSDEEGGLFSGEHSGMFMGFLDQEIGKQLSRGEGANLASQLLTQLAGDKQTPELAKAKAAAQNNLLSDMARDPRVQAQQMLEEINKINRS